MARFFAWLWGIVIRTLARVPVFETTWTLVQGRRYRLRFAVESKAFADPEGDRKRFAEQLERAGFVDVKVYVRVNELPVGWQGMGLDTAKPPAWVAWGEATWGSPTGPASPDFLDFHVTRTDLVPQAGEVIAPRAQKTERATMESTRTRPEVHLTADHSWGFYEGLVAIAQRHGWSKGAIGMLMVMQSEAGMQHNPPHNGPARGLIQFEPSILAGLGWRGSPDEFAQMSAEDQLPWVERYYEGKALSSDPEPVEFYVAGLTPAFMKQRMVGSRVYGPASDSMAFLAREDEPSLAFIVRDNPIFAEDDDGVRVIRVRGMAKRMQGAATGARWREAVARLAFVEGGGDSGIVAKVIAGAVLVGALATAGYYLASGVLATGEAPRWWRRVFG